jgi:hypothetical protein
MATNSNVSATLPKNPKPGKKYFSLAEANRSLTYVARVVEDLTRCYSKVIEFRRRIEATGSKEIREQMESAYESAMDDLSGYVDELHTVGVELKDFEKGLLDFPAMHDGREIFLCWHRGEKTVESWHEIDAGYAGRKDVALLNQN